MKDKPVQVLTILMAGILMILMWITLAPIFRSPPPQKYLNYNDVRGIAIVFNGLPYTLNFDQQIGVIDFLNQVQPFKSSVKKSEKVDFSKILIYRFKESDIELIPVGYQENHLVFTSPELNNNQTLIDTSLGELKKLLEQSYR